MAKKKQAAKKSTTVKPLKNERICTASAAPTSDSETTDGLPEFVKRMEEQAQAEGRVPLPTLPTKIHLLGGPYASPPLPHFPTYTVPEHLREHQLIKGKCFYTLPSGLLQAIELCAKKVTQKNELWTLEKELAAVCGDHSSHVGFLDGRPLLYALLRPTKPIGLTIEIARQHGWGERNEAQIGNLNRTFDERLKWMNTIGRGYAGWLNSNSEFRRERDKVFTSGPKVLRLMPDSNVRARGRAVAPKVRKFLVRWRLLGMAGSGLPIPMRPMLSGDFPLRILRQLMAAGGLFNLPDIYPIPSRDDLRAMLEDAIRGEKPEHLGEWMKFTASNNLTKTPIARMSRLLELQHYWELLFERHEVHLAGQHTELHGALAEFLNTTADTIKKDLQFLRRKLGKAWPKRP